MRIMTRILLVAIAALVISTAAQAQSTTGTLTVAFNIEPSSTVVVMPNGDLQVYVANPPTSNDSRAIYFPPTAGTKSEIANHVVNDPKVVAVPKKKR